LGDLLDKDIQRISSGELSKSMGLTASQIRQDLNNFGCFGQQGYGYNVELLYNEIRIILGLDKQYSMILVGAGNFGQAILNYPNFVKRGYVFVAVFDNNPELIGRAVGGHRVRDVGTLQDFAAKHHIDIAALAVPERAAGGLAKTLTDAGVKGIWNFSSADLRLTDTVVVENVCLSDSLMTLSYKINEDEILERVVSER